MVSGKIGEHATFNLVSDFNIICSVASTVLGNMVDAEVVCEHGSYSLRAEKTVEG